MCGAIFLIRFCDSIDFSPPFAVAEAATAQAPAEEEKDSEKDSSSK